MFDDDLQLEQLQKLEEKRELLERSVSDPKILKSREYPALVRELHDLTRLTGVWRELVKKSEELSEAKELLNDHNPEIRELAQEDMENILKTKSALEEDLAFLLLPKDPNDEKNTVVEIRAGTGGDEAAIFAGDLYRMYTRFAERRGWKTEILSMSPSPDSGYKEVIFLLKGDKVYSLLKHESGVHRVQRVPVTETQGRIHTSACTVAVLPEAEEVEVDIKPEEIKVDVFRSSGPGGQSVNTTDSAVRITHLPTGLVVTCQDEKSQLKNKIKAMTVLRARLLSRAENERQKKIASDRKEQVGSGDRSERIRTYNFPQGRLTDHRVNLTLYRLSSVMDGDLDEIISTVGSFFQARELAMGKAASL
ncbi:MAG: peptide chain release factor 1 [Deltaproteobacteria bacterium]|jgi:peptide chain release factor 1|nr:peptide chain release factor 1 [Deltaproteobacteria bacterium]